MRHADTARQRAVTDAMARPRGMTLASIASQHGISRSTLYRWLRASRSTPGTYPPTALPQLASLTLTIRFHRPQSAES